MKKLLWLFLLGCCSAQTAVSLGPLPQLQFFDQSGRALAFGCVFTYQSGTTTPLGTFTDYTGTTANANPVILSAGGSANIWIISGQAYAFRVKSSGGSNCSSGSTLYTVNGIGLGATSVSTNVTFSATPQFTDIAQNQLFLITLTGNAVSLPLVVTGVSPPGIVTWQITQDGTGGRTFAWPANVIGGCIIGSTAGQVTTQEFIWNGTNATAIGPCVTGNGPVINAATLNLSSGLVINGGAALTTSNSSGTGSICLTTSCAMTTPTIGNPMVSTGTFSTPTLSSPVINGTAVVNQVPQLVCSDGTSTSVNANTTSQQVLKTCLLGTATMNSIGRWFEVTTSQDANPVSGSMVHSVSWGFGTTSALGTYIAQVSESSTTDIHAQGKLTCVTVTTGVSGTMSCIQYGQTDGASTIGLTPYQTTITLDLTGPVYVGQACKFNSASATNTCGSQLLTVERD